MVEPSSYLYVSTVLHFEVRVDGPQKSIILKQQFKTVFKYIASFLLVLL